MECFLRDDGILLRARVACSRKLVEAGFPQERIAKALGCSQAMVSKYLRSRPSIENKVLSREMEALASHMVELLREGVGEEGVLFYFCEHFFEWRRKGLLCNLCHRGSLPVAVLEKEREKSGIMRDLADACLFISQHCEIHTLTPQVRMNIARCIESALSKSDVASIPGRLVNVGERIFAVAPPEFGTSGHLADVLLKVRKHSPTLTSVMNVRLGRDVLEAARKSGLSLTHSEQKVRMLLADRGGFGREPCLYIFAPTAIRVAHIAHTLASNL